MSSLDKLKKLKVKRAFSYYEERVSDTEINFGWKDSEVESVKAPFVVSYGSKSKSISDEDLSWSKQAGVNAASLDDYLLYFKALTGDDPDSFYKKWNNDLESLEEIRKSENTKYRDGEGSFLLSLSKLLSSGEKFTQYGRIFKLIK